MITVICGENIVDSRKYYYSLKEKSVRKFMNFEININQIEEINKWLGEAVTLFSSQKIFFTENLNRYLGKKKYNLFKKLEEIAKSRVVNLVDWEDGKTAKELKFPKEAVIKEFKPPVSIFKLLDNFYPGNFKNFCQFYNQLLETTDPSLIFYMLTKHSRSLLLIKSGEKPTNIQNWQFLKLQKQAKYWSLDKLTAFYEALHRLDILTKTGQNPFYLSRALDILSYYIL